MEGVGCVGEVASFTIDGGGYVYSAVGVGGGGFATGYSDSGIRLWSERGDLVTTLEGHTSAVFVQACSASGDIVSGSSDSHIKVWRGDTCLHTLVGHRSGVYAVAVSPVDDIIVSGSGDWTAKVWSASTGECLASLVGHTSAVFAVCVLENGDIVTGSDDKTVRVWGRGSWACTAEHRLPHQVVAVACVDGHRFAVAGGIFAKPGFVSMYRDGGKEWEVATASTASKMAVEKGVIVACARDTVHVIEGGHVMGGWLSADQYPVALDDGSFLLLQRGGADVKECRVFRFVRPSRLATIDMMLAAWRAHGGRPPPLTGDCSRASVLARTLSLRRLCRPREGGEAEGREEIVEPFARDIVGFV